MAEVAGSKIRNLKSEVRKAIRPARAPAPSAGNRKSGIENRKSLRTVLIANRHPRLKIDRRAVTRVIHTLDANFPAFRLPPSALPAGDLSLVFLTDAALAQLHAVFLADPTPTDVITFAGEPAHGTAGEICVSADAARRQTATTASRPSTLGFSTELTLYLVHGWLHLAGYDDLQPAKKRAMRRAEVRALKILQTAGVRPHFSLRR